MTDKRRASIIISTYNGKHLLANVLTSVVRAVEYDRVGHEIIVVDDGSTDGTAEFIRSGYPLVRLICLEKNRGFGFANNIAVSQSKNDIVILLNNDVDVEKNFIAPLLNHFQDERIFAVSPKILLPDKDMANEAISIPTFKRGQVFVERPGLSNPERKFDEVRQIFYAVGAAAAYDRTKFLGIGGFDPIYYPYYTEDSDLSYRAWKRGWKVIYEPQSVVYHQGRATIGKLSDHDKIYTIQLKNGYLLFIWKNFTDKKFILTHLFWLAGRLMVSFFERRRIFITAFKQAVRQLPDVWQRRKTEKREAILSDKAVFNLFSTTGNHISRTTEKKVSMRILVVSNLYPPYYVGGMELDCKRNVDGLRKRNHKVYILTSQYGINKEEIDDGVYRLLHFYQSKLRYFLFLGRIRVGYMNFKIVKDTISKIKPDIIYIWGLSGISTIFVLLAIKQTKVSFSIRLEDYWLGSSLKLKIFSHRQDEDQNKVEQFLRYLLTLTMFYRFLKKSNLIATSKMLKNIYVRDYGYPEQNIEVIHQFIEELPPFQEKNININNGIKLLYAGQIIRTKGVDLAIQALEKINQSNNSQFCLDIIGSGDANYIKYLKRVSYKKKIEEKISFIEKISGEALLQKYSEYDIFICPTLRLDPFPNVIIEAMASGVPVIASDKGGHTEIIHDGETGLLFAQGDVDALAKKIKILVSDCKLYHSIRQNAYQLIRTKLDPTKIMGETEECLNNARSMWNAHSGYKS